MTHTNRVTPRSEIIASPERGTLMGNRGCLHNGHDIIRRYRGNLWISCVPDYLGNTVPQWAPGRYTVLFFTDEAVALAAGHRPCARCRRPAFNDFTAAWNTAFDTKATATDIDRQLHADRLDHKRQRTHKQPWTSLPDGAFAIADDTPVRVHHDTLIPWTPSGYDRPQPRPTIGTTTVLTPRTIVEILHARYQPYAPLPRPGD